MCQFKVICRPLRKAPMASILSVAKRPNQFHGLGMGFVVAHSVHKDCHFTGGRDIAGHMHRDTGIPAGPLAGNLVVLDDGINGIVAEGPRLPHSRVPRPVDPPWPSQIWPR